MTNADRKNENEVTTVTLNPCIDRSFSIARLEPDRKLYGFDERVDPGGGGLNVARVITRLGGSAMAVWTRGGVFGDLLYRLLDAEGVRQQPVSISGATRENVIVHETSTSRLYRLDMPGPLIQPDELESCAVSITEAARNSSHLVLSGSLPPGASPEWFESLVARISHETFVVVDAKSDSLRSAIEGGAHLVKPNRNELVELVGRQLVGDEEVEAASVELVRNSNLVAVVVSLGPAGALLATREFAERIYSPSVPVHSSVGAGDSMVGAMVLALSRGESLKSAVRYGVAAGSAAVMAHGTQLAAAEDVATLYGQMNRAV